MDVTFQATDQFGVSAGIAYLNSELADDFCGFLNAAGKPQQSPCVDGDGNVLPPQASEGTMLPVTPEWKANATARYEFNVSSFDSYVQGSVIYSSEREADLRTIITPTDYGLVDPLYIREVLGQLPSYTVADLAAGFGKNDWRLELFVQNVFDERAQVGRFAQCLEEVCGQEIYVVPQRPRTIGLKFSQEF
jgi:outer membrane receptor protein involved in Fe transport